jgi:hypothetical protein
MDKKAKNLYYVAVKVFLKRGGDFLIFKDGFGKWDLPGGSIKYQLGEPFVFMRHERKEIMSHGPKKARIFAIGYRAKFAGGTINLPSHHTKYEWAPIKTFKPEKYFEGGWLDGIKTFLALERKKKQNE